MMLSSDVYKVVSSAFLHFHFPISIFYFSFFMVDSFFLLTFAAKMALKEIGGARHP